MKTKLYLFALLAQFFSMTTFAYDAEIDGIYYNFSGTEAEVTYQRYSVPTIPISDYKGDIVIPESVTYNGKTYTVTSIGSEAFYNCGKLTSVSIPEGVTRIGSRAFMSHYELASITIPNSVISIGMQALEGTAWYNKQQDDVIYAGKVAYGFWGYMPENTTVNIKEGTLGIADYAFQDCSTLTSITIPNSVINIGTCAFENCSGLTSVIISESVVSIGYRAFDGTAWYEEQPDGLVYAGKFAYKYKGTMSGSTSLEIKEGTLGLADCVFAYCSGLTSISIPESVKTISNEAFEGCRNLTSITIPESVTTIGNYAFAQCSRLISINIPQSVKSIGGGAFRDCSALSSIIIPEGITSLKHQTFYGCSRLTSISIPKSVTVIDDSRVFYSCYGLNSIIVEDGNSEYDSREDCNAIIETSSNTLIIGCKNTIIPNGVTCIGDGAFDGCRSLTSINIPDGVTRIANDAFYDCSALTSIIMPNSLTSIGRSAFNGCSGLTSITIPNSVISIDDYSFYGCNGLKSIVVEEGNTVYDSRNDCNAIIETASKTLIVGCKNTIIPENVTGIGDNAFSYIKDLQSITIPEGVTSIGSGAFSECSRLTSITIPNSVTSIGSAFWGTDWYNNQPDGLVYAGKVAYKYKGTMPENTTIELKDGTSGIAEAAFSGCAGLTSILIPNSVISIGNYAFQGCTNMTSITIPKGVTSIGNNTFQGCKSLTSVNIPDGVASIGFQAFQSCSSLTSLIIPNGVVSIEGYAFERCSSLTSITLPESVMVIGDCAFDCALYGDSELSYIKVGMRNPVLISYGTFTSHYRATTLYVPRGSKSAYEAADYWNECEEIVECDYVDVEDQIIVAGQYETMEISVNTKPHTNLVGFQMDLTLPEGVSIDKAGCSLSSRITDEKLELTIGKLESGTYRLTSTSLSLKPISDTDGTLLTLKLIAAKDCVDGKATISNIIFSTADSERVTMDDEAFDITIYYTYKLSYLIDGEEYLTDSVVYNTPIAPIAEPTKEGYTFYEWIGQPEIMPNHDVEVTAVFYRYGDVNTDDEVDVVDVVDIARFVVATPSNNFREKLADLNYDNTVNIADAVTLVNYIAGNQNFVKSDKPIGESYDYAQCQLQLQSTGQKALSLCLAGGADFTAFQFEVDVPENTDITAMRINGLRKDGHQLLYNKVSENRYRVAALSLSNATFQGSEGELLNISIDGLATDDVCIHDIHFVKANGTDVTFDTLYLSGHVTNIADVDGTESGSIYDLQGRHRSTLQRGLNIVGNKTIIKK